MSVDKALDRLMEGREPGGLFGRGGVLAELTALAERASSTELDAHPGEERADASVDGDDPPPDRNRREGGSQKTVTTESGKVVLDIPRDRRGRSTRS